MGGSIAIILVVMLIRSRSSNSSLKICWRHAQCCGITRLPTELSMASTRGTCSQTGNARRLISPSVRWWLSTTRHCSATRFISGGIERVLIACEAKTVMTEHGKSQPRVFDELGSSHEIVHQGDRQAIAAGITVVNIASTFVSPLRQKSKKLHVSQHKQPHAAERMVSHLRGLPIRKSAA